MSWVQGPPGTTQTSGDERAIAKRKQELKRLEARATLRRTRPRYTLPACPHGYDTMWDCPGCCDNADRHDELWGFPG